MIQTGEGTAVSLAKIGTLWVGPELSWLEQLCLKSFVDHGHEVTLFCYDKVDNVPDGVRQEPASSVLSGENIIRHTKTGSPAYHADVFRLHMIRDTDLVWADTDAFCLRPWDIPPDSHFHGWISDNKPSVNNGVLGLPKDSATLAAMLAFTSDPYPIPPWYSDDKQAALRTRREAGDGVHVSDLPWGVWGPDALTWFLHDTGEIAHSQPGHVLYPVPFAMAGVVLNPNRRRKAGRFLKEDTLSIHFWGRRFRNIAAKYGGIPAEGTLVHDLLALHGIDPAPTAARFLAKAGGDAPITGIDTTMLSDGDIANLILQRSETVPDQGIIRAWTAGDDGPLLAHARANREAVVQKALQAAAREVARFAPALDDAPPASIADIGCGYAFADLFLFRRFGCAITLLDIESSEARHFGLEEDGAGYANLAKARAFLETNGVPGDKITTINPSKAQVPPEARFDLVFSLISCGFHYPAETYDAMYRDNVAAGGHIVLDIRKGSGGVKYLKGLGAVEVLHRDAKHAMVLARRDSAPAPTGWGEIAEELSGEDGFFRDLGAHSFLHVKRGDTLVVTFDNLDIVMEKRDDRRPWGYAFIEREGWSMLGVMASGWTWFRDEAVIAEFERLRDEGFFAGFARVVFYGASMGGYGACVFSAIVPGATVVAISPQSTLDKSVVPWETRYKKAWGRDYSGPYGDAATAIGAVGEANIFFDPYEPLDRQHAARIAGPTVRHWRCPLLGHRLGSSLNQMGVLGEIVRAAINGSLTAPQFHRALRARKTFPRYQKELLAQAMARGRIGLARRICRYVLAQREDGHFRRHLSRIEKGKV